KIHKDDMGYIIGRQGNTAKAIRTLLKVIGAKNNSRINFKIEEPEGSDRKFEKREEKVDTDMVDDLKI
ncbi:KH domain-containing protein, partial [Candidatus Parcubacteria bacterium]|nr:KH domain-containing protein [Candidatus Parcubacteria bacterium]